MSGRRDIQGNILRGYASHCHAAYLLARVGDPAPARALLARLVKRRRIATERDWGERPATLLNVGFTYAGLERLEVKLTAFEPYDDFREGMRRRARTHLGDLGANDPEEWEPALRQEIDVLFTVYGDSPDAREDAARDLGGELDAAGITRVHEQRADMLEGNREHFGFTDGFSQPALAGVAEDRRSRRGEGVQRSALQRLFVDAWRDVRIGEFVLGHTDEDGVVPGGSDPLLVNGTFMVWRKLEQDVHAFNAWIREHASGGEDAETVLKARILGRWPGGESLIRRPASGDAYSPSPSANAAHDLQINDFSYRDDPDGLRCPLGAHVRRSNPRDALGFRTERTRRSRIIRRGMPYAEHGDPPARGLIFVCFNSSITRQFEQIQGNWLMGGDAFGLGAERDFLTGGIDPARPAVRMTIQGDRRRPPRFLSRREQFVTVRGGHYLFVPGIAALRRIVGG